MTRRESATAAGAAVQRVMQGCMGPGSAEQLALAQVRVAWHEVMEQSRLAREPLRSRVVRVTGGTAHVEASDPMLAQELSLRAADLAEAMNARMAGRPGATIVVRGLAVSVHRGRG